MGYFNSRVATLIVFLFLLGLGCGGSKNRQIFTNANTAPTQQAINFQLSLAGTNSPQAVRAQSTSNVATFEFSFFSADGKALVGPLAVDAPQPLPNPFAVTVPAVPLNTEMLLRIKARDSQGNTLFDTESRVSYAPPVATIEVGLTPVADTVSAAFYVVPNLQLDTDAAQELATRYSAELSEHGMTLVDEKFLLYPPSLAVGWRVELGSQTGVVGTDGRLRMPAPPTNVTQGRIVHPSSPEISVPFQVSQLTQGQVADKAFAIRLPFAGPCGMDERTLDDPLCDGIISLPQSQARAIAVLLQTVRRPSRLTANDCNNAVPDPTEARILDRGRYPDPSQLIGGVERFTDCHNSCEQLNGFIESDNTVTNAEGVSEISYIGSVCFRYVRLGCCPNENTLSDLEGAIATPGQALVQAVTGLASFFVDIPTIEVVDATVEIDSDTSCLDNHKGRECQSVFIGDISLDFRASGRAPLIKANSPEPVIRVQPGETIPFVIHNNGCFGVTDATPTLQEIGGVLNRTFREQILGPSGGQRQLMVSTDPLLGGTQTTGRYTTFTKATTNRNVTPVGVGTLGFGAAVSQIEHFLIDSSKQNKLGICDRYRYFPDIAMEYKVPSQAAVGSRDRFVFTVDECSVPVTFVVVAAGTFPDPIPSTSPSPSPSPSTEPPPADLIQVNPQNVSATHNVGSSPCPQQIAQIAIGNVLQDAVSVSLEASAHLQLDSTSLNLTGGTGAALVNLFFDCSTQTSFSGTVTLRATTPGGAVETVQIPVNMTINP